MKKVLLALSLTLLFLSNARANSITVQNLLGNPVTLFFFGVNPSGLNFTTSPVTFPPGPTMFADPTLIPGALPYAEPTGRVIAAFGFCNPYDLAVGSPNISGVAAPSQNVPANNDCNNGMAFSIFWNEPNTAPYNAVLLIF